MSEVLRKVGPFEITADDVIRDLRLTLKLEPLIRGSAIKKLVFAECERLGIKISDTELQAAADQFRQRHQLFKAKQTFAFLEAIGATLDDLEENLEFELLAERLKKKLFSDRVEGTFVEHQLRFDEIEIRHLVIKDEGTAQELLTQMKEDKVPFTRLAKKHTLDVLTKRIGGYVGWVRRGAHQQDIEAKLFHAKAGSVVGPFKVPAGFELIEVLDVRPAKELTPELREEIVDGLFHDEFIMKHLPPVQLPPELMA